MSEDEGLKLKVGVSVEGASAELVAGKALPEILKRVLPGRALKQQVREGITAAILGRLEKGQLLDDADLAFLKSTLGRADARWIREKQIAARAAAALGDGAPLTGLLGAAPPGKPETGDATRPTSEDWVSRFWEDAGLVSDEMLQELYGRILASEARGPGSCSLRTLQVMRALDRTTAKGFATIARAAIHCNWIPRDDDLLKSQGIGYDLILEMHEAGLVDSNPLITGTVEEDPLILRYGEFVLFVRNAANLTYDHFPLTRAGRELARVAQVEHSEEYFSDVVRWLMGYRSDIFVARAKMPHPAWQGTTDLLTWHVVPPPPDSPPGGAEPGPPDGGIVVPP